MRSKIAACVFISCIYLVNSLGDCVCDLTIESCDAYCCCDSDCVSSVINVWKSDDLCVKSKFTTYQTRCSTLQHVSIDNTRRAMQVATDSVKDLLCIYIDNSPDSAKKYDLVDETNLDIDLIDERIRDSAGYSDMLASSTPTVTRTTLKPGDLMGSTVSG